MEEEQIQLLEEASFENAIYEKVRDLFLFQVYTGFTYVDMYRFDFERDTFSKQ